MEPLSIAAGIVQVVSMGEKLLRIFHASEVPGHLESDILVFEVHLGILQETSQYTLASTIELPPITQSCAQLCMKRLLKVGEVAPDGFKSHKISG